MDEVPSLKEAEARAVSKKSPLDFASIVKDAGFNLDDLLDENKQLPTPSEIIQSIL